MKIHPKFTAMAKSEGDEKTMAFSRVHNSYTLSRSQRYRGHGLVLGSFGRSVGDSQNIYNTTVSRPFHKGQCCSLILLWAKTRPTMTTRPERTDDGWSGKRRKKKKKNCRWGAAIVLRLRGTTGRSGICPCTTPTTLTKKSPKTNHATLIPGQWVSSKLTRLTQRSLWVSHVFFKSDQQYHHSHNFLWSTALLL